VRHGTSANAHDRDRSVTLQVTPGPVARPVDHTTGAPDSADPLVRSRHGRPPASGLTALLDGPQLNSRWAARYASVPADDPIARRFRGLGDGDANA
jgi:hypothetical protein